MPIEFVCKIKFAEGDVMAQRPVPIPVPGVGVPVPAGLAGEETCVRSTGVANLQTFASASSLHGIDHVFVSGRVGMRQVVWALAFVASLALFLYQAAKSAVAYLEHPHVAAMGEQAGRNMVFPAVTLCNVNRFRFSALTDADIYHLANLTGLPPKNRAGHRPGDLEYPAPDMLDIFNRTGHQLEHMLKSCNFSGQNCTAKDFTVVYTRYGKCYTFNGNRTLPKRARQGGMGNGLEMMLDIEQDEYLPIWRETNETSLEAGIRVQIHSQEEPPYIHQLGFGVSPGFQTFVSCQEQRLTYLPQPWGNCRAKAEQVMPGYDTYSISACRLSCESAQVMAECNCRMVHMPGDAAICPPSKIKCVDKALASLQKNEGDICPCVTPCNVTRYGKELSMVKIPSRGSARYLSRKYDKTEEYIRDNFLVLDIFFEALNYEKIEQKKAYDVAGLLGDIGGQMGLFIGASILTILEIIEYIYEVIKYKLKRLFRPIKSQRNQNQNQIPCLQNHTDQNLRTQLTDGTIATVRLEDVKAKEAGEITLAHQQGVYPTSVLPNHHHHHLLQHQHQHQHQHTQQDYTY
ncbi:acid-sensing ion channel 4-A-like [Clupea harengus]|uniref:Acid-sensing ion channel 4-A-like n=1 Tax=Clupea harengus TaxID=7950 RepID=A0A6P3W8G1_CLUHA|nr:acid-sensing ion channel 4-A-like [Clupea harengus]